jgi:uncharacterized coiled-coil protein SlyX
MTEALLKAIAAKTNAIDAVNDALAAEWKMIEELSVLVSTHDPDEATMQRIRDGLAELKALNSALPAAVVANVAPATAGPVGKSATEHLFEQADAVVAEGLARVADGAEKAQALAEALRSMFESLHTSANAIGAGKAMKEAAAGA